VTRAFSGKPAGDLTVSALVRDELVADDVRIHPETLQAQAAVAERHDNPQLAENFRRAAELTAFAEDEILSLYEALRPHRSTAVQLEELRASLEARGAARCAELVGQAAVVYARRGLLR